MTQRGVPAVAAWLLHHMLPTCDRDAIVGDLDEEYGHRASDSAAAATRWYWSQVCRTVPRLLLAQGRRGLWLSTAVALGVYVIVGTINFAAATVAAHVFGPSSDAYGWRGVWLGLGAITIGGYVAAAIRRGAATVLGAVVAIAAIVLMASPADSAPRWYQLTFLVCGPLAAAAGKAAHCKYALRQVSRRPPGANV